jgi:formylglycine-generating enzyme required for sulfatase activity
MSRLFISHSGTDSVAAKAFKQWLGANGWPGEDVFLDKDDIHAGELWKDALRRANLRCEAIILLASPEALASPECLAEIRMAEDYGKAIIVVLLRDLELDDRRLQSFKDKQIVGLTTSPLDHVEMVQFEGRQHEVRFNAHALQRIRTYLVKRGLTPDHFGWPPADRPNADPFPGLSPFTTDEAGIFFGRDADILRGLDKLRVMRRNGQPQALVIQAASGAGKSSYLRAGLWPRLERDPDYAPVAILRPAKGILTGPNGLGRQLAARLSRPGRPVNPGDVQAQLMAADAGAASRELSRMLGDIMQAALEQRRLGDRDAVAPALVLAVDQAEELFAAEDADESQRFAKLLARLVREPPAGMALFTLFAVRADAAMQLHEMLRQHAFDPPETLLLLPLPRTSYREIVLKPLDLLAERGEKVAITPDLVERLIADSTGADALPLLAFTLSSLYADFAAAGTIGLEQYEVAGGVAGSIQRALKRALASPGDSPVIPAGREAQLAALRETFIPWLAAISPDTGLPMRRVAKLTEFSGETSAMVERLVAARLLVVDRHDGADVVEIAHESLLRQWPELTEWLRLDGENLKVIEGVERAAREWSRDGRKRAELLDHRSRRLRAAETAASRKDFARRLGPDGRAYLAACRASERRRALSFGALVGGLAALLVGGTLAWRFEAEIADALYRMGNVQALTAAAEQDLAPLAAFRECTDCPDMVVLPAGSFEMGAQGGGQSDRREFPAHEVSIPQDFAVSATPVTFAQFTACAEHGDCLREIALNSNDDRPAVNVTWADAQAYAAWLSHITGKSYRLLSEAEYEYAARAGRSWRFPWGDGPEDGRANCVGCGTGSTADGTTPVGTFPANGFGLRDMAGNVFQWVADCYHDDYVGAPADGSAWATAGCENRVVRGASYLNKLSLLRSSWRDWRKATARDREVGFRVARVIVR